MTMTDSGTLAEELDQQIADAYRGTERVDDLISRFGISYSRLYRVLDKYDVPRRGTGNNPPNRRQAMPTPAAPAADAVDPFARSIEDRAREAHVELELEPEEPKAPETAILTPEALLVEPEPPLSAPETNGETVAEPSVLRVLTEASEENEPEPGRPYRVIIERIVRESITLRAEDFADAASQAQAINGILEVVSVERTD